ncbi:MAG: putative ribosomal N-acetyltransferase YdaF [Eubacteriales bacterium SKADARSKE-1]|nr:putative ribosomal N-acetyltransferase YdaF [Eubacteriales bacterium SKADARSKE-1]
MLNHIGTQIIETERLILREFNIDDAQQMFDNWAKDSENVKYLSWQSHKNISDTYEILERWINKYKNQNYYNWCITFKDTAQVIGGIDVNEIIELRSTCEIGYVLSKNYWNKGIMTEALRAVMKYLFSEVGFNRIQLRHMTENPASARVMVKCRMKYEGTLRQYGVKNNGEWCDMAIYSILKNELE